MYCSCSSFPSSAGRGPDNLMLASSLPKKQYSFERKLDERIAF